MRTLGAPVLPTPNHLIPQTDFRFLASRCWFGAVELGAGEDLESSQIVGVQLLNRVEQIAVKSHQATFTGANRRVTARRSVRVQP